MAPGDHGQPRPAGAGRGADQQLLPHRPGHRRQFARVTFLSDNRADLAAVRTPTLVLQCSEDVIAPEVVGAYVHRDLPTAARAARGHRALPEPERPRGDDRGDPGLPGVREPDGDLLEESAEDLYENAPCGYLSTAPDGTIVKVNRTFAALDGPLRRDDLLGGRFQDLLTVGGADLPRDALRAAAADAGRGARDRAGRRPRRRDAAAGADQRGGAGRRRRPGAIRTTVFEATDRRRYEQELVAARATRARHRAASCSAACSRGELPTAPGLDVDVAYLPAASGARGRRRLVRRVLARRRAPGRPRRRRRRRPRHRGGGDDGPAAQRGAGAGLDRPAAGRRARRAGRLRPPARRRAR